MTYNEAMKIGQDFYSLANPSEDDVILFIEAMDFLIDSTHESRFMMMLGGYYYAVKDYHLARKYYEMAAECGDPDSCAGLGYIYYYGRTGEPDYEKAFKYYSKAMEAGDIQCTYKVADMYKNGYFVGKDYDKYKQIIEQLYPKVKNARELWEPLPEVFTRLAKIRSEEGKTDDALRLYWNARDFLRQRIQYNPFFGNLSIMKWLITDLYTLQPFDPEEFSLYDLYWVLREPNRVHFRYDEKEHIAESLIEEGAVVIHYDDRWYRTVDDFFAKAAIDGELLTSLEDELYMFEVEKK